jgi:hypothetical protein
LEAFWLQEWEWVLEDCHKRSCWKNSIGVSVPRLYRSDVYVCSNSCWLCLTVIYWLLECNKVPSWIEPPSTLQYHGYKNIILLLIHKTYFVRMLYYSASFMNFLKLVLHVNYSAMCKLFSYVHDFETTFWFDGYKVLGFIKCTSNWPVLTN